MSTTVATRKNTRTRKQWADIINADWRKSIEGIIAVGRDLVTAKQELSHGEFAKMVSEDLFFARNTAHQLMRIAQNPSIVSSRKQLPPSWRVLSALSKLSAEDFWDAKTKGLVGPSTSLRAAEATYSAYNEPEGAVVGEGHKQSTLPKPDEARNIARETGRMVAASDGNVYSGATEEEGEDHIRRRQQTYGIIDAINTLADCPASPSNWVREAEKHWIHQFRLGSVDAAIEWLTALRPHLAKKQGVTDA